jgi:hypothetical protein
VIWKGTKQGPEKYIIEAWSYKRLVGGKVVQRYRVHGFEYDKSYGADIIMKT